MFNFDFYNPTHIVFGKDRMGELENLVPKNARVLITYGGGSVKKFGTLEKVKENLKGRVIFEFEGIEPNPRYETLMRAVDIVKKEKVDFLLAVGGGSVMDGTKFISLASTYDGEGVDILNGKYIDNAIPMGTVVTLPATGSEMNCGAVISYKKTKKVVMNKNTYPKFSILDPTLTYTLPETQVANGIVDTFIHVVEQYVTYPVDAKFQDRTAEGILQTLIEIGEGTIKNPTDYDLRANLVWSATMGLNGLIGVGVPQDWATHMIGHEITGLYGIDHAKTLAILQPSIWKIRRDKKREKLLQYGERVWGIKAGNEDERIDEAIKKTRGFFEKLGIKTHLRDYGLTEKNIPEIIEALKLNDRTALSETGDLTLDICEKILIDAL